MKKTFILMTILALSCLMAVPAVANDKPGEGVTVTPARATWDTGYFQEALLRRAMEELGYEVEKPTDLQNPIFYQSVALGDVDYWANGWFPIHEAQLPPNFYDTADKYGYVIKSGGLQGYLVSKDAADEFGITSLDDFKRPEVKAAFDANGDGMADLVACPPGWGCETTINYHLDVYGLEEDINPITAAYNASFADAIARFQSGEPVFFYTWAPNWTIFKLKPGKDVVWINVPEIKPHEAQAGSEEFMVASGVEGAVTDPVKLGFVVSDIRIVANKAFVEANPAAKALFEVFAVPLADINAQNTRMNDGENTEDDIETHVDEWIAANQETWDSWLATARAAE